MACVSLQALLQEVLLRVACDHPYHSLYHLFALKNGNRDRWGHIIHGEASLFVPDAFFEEGHSKVQACSARVIVHLGEALVTC